MDASKAKKVPPRDPDDVHNFNLHGCCVFDSYQAISCPPPKGLLAPVDFLTPGTPEYSAMLGEGSSLQLLQKCLLRNASSESAHSTSSRGNPSHPDSTNTNSSNVNSGVKGFKASAPAEDQPSFCVLPVYVDVSVLQNLASVTPATPVSCKPGVVAKAEAIVKKRTVWMNFLKGLTRTSTNLSVGSGQTEQASLVQRRGAESSSSSASSPVEENGELGDVDEAEREELKKKDPASDYLGDIDHVQAFIAQSRFFDGPDSASQTWINDVASMLQRIESLGCFGVMLMVQVEEQHRSPIVEGLIDQIDFPSFFSPEFRSSLAMPAVFVKQGYYDPFISMMQSGAIKFAALCPIPLLPGDHIYRQIRSNGLLRHVSHHGIYMGNGRVIHYAGNEAGVRTLLFHSHDAKIKSTDVIQFMKHGSQMKVVKYRKSQSATETLEGAEQALAEQSFPEYSLLKNNCEHFCAYCKTGVGRSKQVEKGVKAVAVGSAVVLTTIAAAGLAVLMAKRK